MNETLQLAATIGGALAVALGAFWTGWQSLQAKHQAARAAENSHPISNGWGAALREDIAALRESDDRTGRLVERIHEGQLLAERRDIERDRQLQVLTAQVHTHLTDHPA